jgi:hypothetical protein
MHAFVTTLAVILAGIVSASPTPPRLDLRHLCGIKYKIGPGSAVYSASQTTSDDFTAQTLFSLSKITNTTATCTNITSASMTAIFATLHGIADRATNNAHSIRTSQLLSIDLSVDTTSSGSATSIPTSTPVPRLSHVSRKA